jgi:hypothetical protein
MSRNPVLLLAMALNVTPDRGTINNQGFIECATGGVINISANRGRLVMLTAGIMPMVVPRLTFFPSWRRYTGRKV